MPTPVQKQIDNLKAPSKLKYFFFGILAFMADIVDVIAAFTVIGIILSFVVDLIVAPILFMAGFGANSRIKAMNNTIENMERYITRLGREVTRIRTIYAQAYKASRYIPGLRRIIRRSALAFRAVRLKTIRNPLFKNAAAIAADLVPYLDIVPWRTVALYLTYKDEKKTYEEAMENMNLALAAENQVIQVEVEARQELLAA